MRVLPPVFIAFVIALTACDSSTKPEPGSQTPPLPDSLVYLGQDPPGLTPVRFAPEHLLANEEWFWHGSPSFSLDGREMYWCKYIRDGYELDVQHMEVVDNTWTDTRSVSFNSEYGENNPVFTFDGERVYYVSGRQDGFIYSVARQGDGWTDPEPVNVPIPSSLVHGWQFTLAADGTLYFELWGSGGRAPDLYRSDLVAGEYTDPVKLHTLSTAYNEFAPYVHPDHEYIIFVSNRPGGYGMHDLYVSFRGQDDSWELPVNMGPEINSDFEDAAPLVSPDGNYLFFNTVKEGDLGFNPYWVDVQVIEDLELHATRQ
jgi:Tol biopolymer transport system component